MKKLLLFGAIALSLNSFGQAPNYVPTNNLLAWYPFNSNTLDESFNGNNGTIFGGITLSDDRFNIANSAQLFDGVPVTYIDCGNDAMLNITNNGSLTVSAWARYNTTSGQEVILSKNSSYNTNIFGAYTLWMNNGVPRFTITNQGGLPNWYETAVSLDTLALNTWSFLTGVIDYQSLEIRLYVNGTLVDSQPWGGTIDDNVSSSLLIGSHYKAGFASEYMSNFNGEIDDIGLWDRVLNQCEIVDLYTSGMLGGATQNGAQLNANQTGVNYQWLDCDDNNAIVSGETNQTYTPEITGNYAVEVTMNGCVDTSDCFLVDYTGIEEFKSSLVNIYPNPSSDNFKIIGIEKLKNVKTFEITSITGARVAKRDVYSSVIDISSLDKGIYLFIISHENGIEKIRFIKD
jgi:hypothetical protein